MSKGRIGGAMRFGHRMPLGSRLLHSMAEKITTERPKKKGKHGGNRVAGLGLLSLAQILELRTLHEYHRWSLKDLANRYGISVGYATTICYYKSNESIVPRGRLTDEPPKP